LLLLVVAAVVGFAQVAAVQVAIAQALLPLIPIPSIQSLSALVVLVATEARQHQGYKVLLLRFSQPHPLVAVVALAQM
jgi:hypothetical protein